MSEKSNKTKRGGMLEFTLPGQISAVVQEAIGPRRLAKLSPEVRSEIIAACNVAAESIADAVGKATPGAKRRSPRKPAAGESGDSSGDGE